MAKFVICTLANAALSINGIAFEETKGGVVSVDPVDDADAERFGSIPGYELVDEKPGKVKREKPVADGEPKKRGGRKPADADAAEGAGEGDAAAEGETAPEGDAASGEAS